jgi:predicted CoA-binding protein
MHNDNSTLRDLLRQCKTIAVVGLSADWHRPSFFAAKYVQSHGYKIIPVNPRYAATGQQILGETVYASLLDIPQPVDMVDVFRRTEDVLPLAKVLLADAAQRMKRAITGLAPEAADQLLRHDWPGNVRELENAMERAVALARGALVELEDLPEEVRVAARITPAPQNTPAVRPLEDVEKDYILAALEQNGGNQTHTAQQLHRLSGDLVGVL